MRQTFDGWNQLNDRSIPLPLCLPLGFRTLVFSPNAGILGRRTRETDRRILPIRDRVPQYSGDLGNRLVLCLGRHAELGYQPFRLLLREDSHAVWVAGQTVYQGTQVSPIVLGRPVKQNFHPYVRRQSSGKITSSRAVLCRRIRVVVSASGQLV